MRRYGDTSRSPAGRSVPVADNSRLPMRRIAVNGPAAAPPRLRCRPRAVTSVRVRPPMLSEVRPPASVPVGSRKRTRVPLAFGTRATAGTVALKNWPAPFWRTSVTFCPGSPSCASSAVMRALRLRRSRPAPAWVRLTRRSVSGPTPASGPAFPASSMARSAKKRAPAGGVKVRERHGVGVDRGRLDRPAGGDRAVRVDQVGAPGAADPRRGLRRGVRLRRSHDDVVHAVVVDVRDGGARDDRLVSMPRAARTVDGRPPFGRLAARC